MNTYTDMDDAGNPDLAPSGTEDETGFRMDIQGIRAIAIGLVILAHSQISAFAGGFVGIDVFFVLSGFLITGLVVKEIEATGRVSLRDFYARRARRLLPLAAVVLTFIALGSLLLFPMSQQIEVGKQIVGAAFYFVNWMFAAQHVDYFNADSTFVSPVQHYWSLSVEEQFYLVWPVIMLAVTTVAVKLRRQPRAVLLKVLYPLAIGSLIYSVVLTSSNPDAAYFSTLTRAWELAFGAILAMKLPRSIDLRDWVANGLVSIGLVLIVGSAIVFDASSEFPGLLALFPVMGTIAVLIGGTSDRRSGMIDLLCGRTVQFFGEISYGWYLWHWPFIIFASTIWPDLSPFWLLTAAMVSLVPAQISNKLIENPLRQSGTLRLWPRRALAIGAVCSVSAASVGVALAAERLDVQVVSGNSVAGAAVVTVPGVIPFQERVSRIAPDPLTAGDDRSELFADGCLAWGDDVTQPACTYGGTSSKKSVVLFGDSRAMSFFPAIEPVALERNWKLVGLTRGNCTPALVDYERYCDEWRSNMIKRIKTKEKPDLVIIGSTTKSLYKVNQNGKQLSRLKSEPYLVKGMVKTIKAMKAAGAEVVVIRDQSMAPFVPSDCISEHLRRLDQCAFKPGNRKPFAFELAAAKKTGVRTIDPQRLFCSHDVCPAVIGDAVVDHDRYHVTATYARTMAPWFAEQLPRIGRHHSKHQE